MIEPTCQTLSLYSSEIIYINIFNIVKTLTLVVNVFDFKTIIPGSIPGTSTFGRELGLKWEPPSIMWTTGQLLD